jgi:CBS domain-containing protein
MAFVRKNHSVEQGAVMKVSDIMNRFPKTVAPAETLMRARDLMVWGDYRYLPVMDAETGRLLGILDERDIAQYEAKMGESIRDNPSVTVSMAMRKQVHTAGPDDSVAEATARMAAEGVGCLPITRLGKLVGLLTATDTLAAGVRAGMHTANSGGPTIGEVMTRNPKVARADDYLLDAAARMRQYNLRHLPVVDVDNHVIGMLSDRDVRACIGEPSRAFGEDLSVSAMSMHVRHAMSTPVVTTTAEESCATAARAFVDLKASSVPVVDEENLLVGIVSYLDLLGAYARDHTHENTEMRRQ